MARCRTARGSPGGGERGEGAEKTASRVRGKPATTTAVERDDSSREHRALLFLATVHVRLSTCALVCNVVYRAHTSKQLAASRGTVWIDNDRYTGGRQAKSDATRRAPLKAVIR